MSPDWASKPEAVPYSQLDNPQSLNLYGYIGNNPLSRADADGHCCQGFKDFMNGASGAYTSDVTAGISARDTPDSTEGRVGAFLGDLNAAIQGGLEVVVATGGEAGGLALDATGVGALAGVPINIASAAVGVHGVATAGTAIVAMGRGSYTNTHQSGKTYSGKGDKARSQASGKRVEKATDDKHVATDHTAASSDRESFKDESRRIDANGGAGSSSNHNQIESPGKNYRQQDGSH